MNYEKEFVNSIVTFYKSTLDNIRKIKLTKLDEKITHGLIVPYATYSPWFDDEDFMDIYTRIKNNTLVDIYRCFELWRLVKSIASRDGDILEVGVWKGGTGALIAFASAKYSKNRVFLADTFTGVVKASEHDTLYKGGEHSDTSLEIVEGLLSSLDIKNVSLLKGVFPDQINFDLESKNVTLKLCHIDVDTFESARAIFDYVWPRITIGGVVVFDDYGFWGCEGVTKLCNSISKNEGVFIHNLNGHGLVIKTL